MSMNSLNDMNAEQATEFVTDCLAGRLVPYLTGSPGVGKSAIIYAIANRMKLKIIDLRLAQCDPTDLNGFPTIDKVTGKSTYAPMDTFPLESDEIPEGFLGWLLVLDELSSAPRMVQAAAYKVVLDKAVGQHKLHAQCYIVAAGNLDTDNAIVEEMGTAMQSRLIHGVMTVDFEVWLKWARNNGIDHRLTSYIQANPDKLYQFDPDHDDHTFRCPRTWVFFSKLIEQWPDQIPHTKRTVLCGAVGNAGAVDFIGYCKVYGQLPDIGDIIRDPMGTMVPSEPNHNYAVAGMIANHASVDNIGNMLKYIDRMRVEFQIVAAREMMGRNRALLEVPAMARWVQKNGKKFF